MRRIATGTNRNPAIDLFGTGKNGFKTGNRSLGDPPSTPGAEWYNSVQETLAQAIEQGMGVALDPNDHLQLLKLIRLVAWGAGKTSAPWAPLDSATLTGNPRSTTAPDGDNSDRIATMLAVQNAVGGYLSKTVTGAAIVTLTAEETSNPVIAFTGALTANQNVVIPAGVRRIWAIFNNTTGAYTLTVKLATGTGVTVAQGKRNLVYTDGVNVYDAFNDFEGIALTGRSTAVTAPAATNDDQISTTAHTHAAIALDRPFETVAANIKINGTQSVGALNTVARADHVHPTDTSRVAKSGDTMTGPLKVKSGTGLATGVKGDVDTDTGLEWVSDGILQFIVNNKIRTEYNATTDLTRIANNSGQFLAFQADGNLVIKAADWSLIWDAFGVTQKYISGDLVMTNGGQIAVNHGLGVEPMHITLYMRCVVADMGYAVGDVIRIAGETDPNGSNESLGVLVNNTQIIIRVGDGGPQLITNKANGTGAAATTANWRLIIKASK